MNELTSTITASSMSSSHATELCTNYMSIDDIKRFAPRAFATAPTNPNLSKHYTFASTETVIEDMKKLGWEVVLASQPHPRRNSSGVSSYHMVSFQNPTMTPITRKDAEGNIIETCWPRIILTNSHDGFSCFTFRIGLFRSICANGLVIATDTFESIHLKHIGYTFEELRKLVDQVAEEVPTQVAVMNKMVMKQLTIDEKRSLALAAIRDRKNDQELEVSNIILDDILTPIRPEDEEDNLWVTFNIIQEKMMTGDFYFETKRGKRKARRITSIWKGININQSLFKAAVNLAA